MATLKNILENALIYVTNGALQRFLTLYTGWKTGSSPVKTKKHMDSFEHDVRAMPGKDLYSFITLVIGLLFLRECLKTFFSTMNEFK